MVAVRTKTVCLRSLDHQGDPLIVIALTHLPVILTSPRGFIMDSRAAKSKKKVTVDPRGLGNYGRVKDNFVIPSSVIAEFLYSYTRGVTALASPNFRYFRTFGRQIRYFVRLLSGFCTELNSSTSLFDQCHLEMPGETTRNDPKSKYIRTA